MKHCLNVRFLIVTRRKKKVHYASRPVVLNGSVIRIRREVSTSEEEDETSSEDGKIAA